MKKKKKKVTVADAEETPEPSPAPAPAPVDDTPAPVAEAEAVAEVEAPVATPEPSTEKPAEDSGDLFTDLKKKKKKKKDIPLDLVRFFSFFVASGPQVMSITDILCDGKRRNLPSPLRLLTVLTCP